jgi:hypothetical protein
MIVVAQQDSPKVTIIMTDSPNVPVFKGLSAFASASNYLLYMLELASEMLTKLGDILSADFS